MSTREFLASVFDNQVAWVLGSVLGLGAALLDLRSVTRWPYAICVCGISLFLTLLQPRWAWRWTLLASLVLPAFVLLSGEWGPYRVDQFDVFYGLVPAGIGTLLGLGLRKTASFRRPPPTRLPPEESSDRQTAHMATTIKSQPTRLAITPIPAAMGRLARYKGLRT